MEVIYVHNYWAKQVVNEEHGSYESQCSNFVDLIVNDYKIELAQPTQKGIYVVTSDAGKMPSIEFWSEGLDHGLAYSSPKNFPWTLANSPCSYFARSLNIQGPNYTLVGNGSACIAAFKHAVQDLLDEEIDEAFVIGIDFDCSAENVTQFAAIVLKKDVSNITIRSIKEVPNITVQDHRKPSEILNLINASIQTKTTLTFGTNNEGFFEIEYLH